MYTVNPTLEEIDEFARTTPDSAAIVMLNLLRYRDVADYGPTGPKGLTGREAYSRYTKAVLPLAFEVGAHPLWMGRVRAHVIAPADELWDEVALMYYPSRSAFVHMVRSDAYQAILKHRTAALLDSRLVETKTVRLPSLMLGAMRNVVRIKSLFFPKMPW